MNIELLHIQGYKSIADLRMENVDPFAIIAGSNGSGKSNLVDALAFLGTYVEFGVKTAMQHFGGYSNIHCFKLDEEQRTKIKFELKIEINSVKYHYSLGLFHLDSDASLSEHLTVDGKTIISRKVGEAPLVNTNDLADTLNSYNLPKQTSALLFLPDSGLYHFLTNIKVFRFDPLAAKEPNATSTDASELDIHGRNVASMLAELEKDEDFREQITEWMELLVPNMEKVTTEQQRLDGTTVITFKEEGTDKKFPANLISDGTIYALCILTALFSRSNTLGLTIIEEPERGIHPKAIAELIGAIRDTATNQHPFFVTTHSESVVRCAKTSELWLSNKANGKTEVKNAALQTNGVDLGDMPLDKAWLMNMFSGGSPW
ncbi:AAA family ATPase [Aliivibrio fischeri]|uniref:AAA family ATPase n=1 Tax=Aliivibrio fischeri TaxID=668 RepID=UPI001414332C|nr:AAA family ATPase [Aliivibrio fischeri]